MSKILKVTFEYEDEIHTLEGEQAEKWLQRANGMCAFSATHGGGLPEYNWKVTKKERKE